MPLVRLEPVGDDDAEAAAAERRTTALELPEPAPGSSPAERAARSCWSDLRSLLLGFDGDPRGPQGAPGRVPAAARRAAPAADPDAAARRARRGQGVRRPVRADPQPAGRRGDRRRAGAQPARVLPRLPAQPRRRPRAPARGVPRAAGAGARPLRRRRARPDPGAGGGRLPDLPRPAAHGRRPAPSITTLLQRWLGDEPPPDEARGERAHDVLDRLVVATQLRYPVVGDLARSARFRWFDAAASCEAARA